MRIIVTGGSSGLGAGLGAELARRGHAVGLIARREAELSQVCAAIEADGGTAAWHVADVTDPDAVAHAIAALETALGGATDVIVANAGRGGAERATRMDPRAVARVLRLNVEGVVNTVAPVLPAMLARESGQIVAVSSVAGYRGLVPGGPYSASKAAVSTLMESWRVELGPYGVAVTTIHPGFVNTPILAGAKHPTPFLVEVDRAARIMADGILARRREVNFPWQMATLMAGVRWLPSWLFEGILRRVSPRPRGPADQTTR